MGQPIVTYKLQPASGQIHSKTKRGASVPNRARAEAWSLPRLLVEADYVAGGVAEPGSDFGGVGSDGLDDFALVGEDGVEGGGHAVAHNVKQKAGLGGGRASEDEGAADLAGGVVKGGAAIAAFADGPVEDLVVEVGGAGGGGGGGLEGGSFSGCG